jgi:hypothetical protein
VVEHIRCGADHARVPRRGLGVACERHHILSSHERLLDDLQAGPSCRPHHADLHDSPSQNSLLGDCQCRGRRRRPLAVQTPTGRGAVRLIREETPRRSEAQARVEHLAVPLDSGQRRARRSMPRVDQPGGPSGAAGGWPGSGRPRRGCVRLVDHHGAGTSVRSMTRERQPGPGGRAGDARRGSSVVSADSAPA